MVISARRVVRSIGITLTAFGLLAALVVAAPSAGAITCASGKKQYTVRTTITGANNLTLVLMSATGTTLAEKKITVNTATVANLVTTDCLKTINDATVQIVNSRGTVATSKSGDYFGPLTIGWVGTTRGAAMYVYEKIKPTNTTLATIDLGASTVVKVNANSKQGYAYTTTNNTALADTATTAKVKAASGKPVGVGNYGKGATGVSVTELGPIEVLPPPPVPGAVDPDATNGGDKDDDGIPNAFDVNDDGDAKVDSTDSTTPTPAAAPEAEKAGTGVADGAACAPVNFRIFTNFKATQPGFAGSINYYAPEPFKATFGVANNSIPNTIGRTMSMVFSKVSNVCGSNVTKTEIKGVGVPYAPADYLEIPSQCSTQQDLQWLPGQGRMCNQPFSTAYTFTQTDLPSGQDTFSMRVTTANGSTYEFSSTPGFVFVTHPMVVGYAKTTDGTSGENIQPTSFTEIDYSHSVFSPDGPSIGQDPSISIARNENLWLKIYRPQRLAIDGELSATGFLDLGGFKYTPDIPNGVAGRPGPGKCDALTTIDSTMTADTATLATGTAPTLILKWNISACYSDTTWGLGNADFDIQVEPIGPGGNAAQKIRIQLIAS